MPRRRLPRRRYTEEFKAEAVRVLQQSDESLAKVALDLGITSVNNSVMRFFTFNTKLNF